MKSRTKDETYLLKLYEKVGEEGDLSTEFDPIAIGEAAGFSSRQIDNIVNGLARTNFIKKKGGGRICLTENGKKLAQSVLEQ